MLGDVDMEVNVYFYLYEDCFLFYLILSNVIIRNVLILLKLVVWDFIYS